MNILKKLTAAAVVAASSVILSCSAFAYTLPENIRVGLEYKYKEVSSVPVANKDIYIGYGDGEDFVSEGEITGSSFKFSVPSVSMASVNKNFSDFNSAKEYADEIKSEYDCTAVPAATSKNSWTVYVLNGSDNVLNDTSASKVTSSSAVVLYDGTEAKVVFDGINPQIKPADSETVTLSDRSYRGVMEFGRFKGKNITAVNVVPFDYYLYSTVPSEMPSTWEKEAIKAQAVAARSYTLTRMRVHRDLGYDVCDGVNCQVYLGSNQERDSVKEAIDETGGKVALYNGQPINAVFFSSSGGSTDDAENVWSNAVPYLRAVKEINEEKRSWTRTFTANEIKNLLAKMNVNIGNIKNMEITKTGEYGRVQEVTVTGTSGTYTLKKEECRTFASSSSGGSLLSRMYTINGNGGISTDDTSDNTEEIIEEVPVPRNYNTYTAVVNGYTLVLPEVGTIFYEDRGDTTVKTITKTKNVSGTSADTFVFEGAGSGHGVGMSQYGAHGMAQKGYTYEEILKHYYTDITIE